MTRPTFPLDRIAAGSAAIVTEVSGPRPLVRRLAEMGLRPGASVTPRHRTAGGGRVLDVAGTRIAVARSVLRAITAEPPA